MINNNADSENFGAAWLRRVSLQWRHNGRDGVSNHQPHHCLLNRLFRRRSKKTSKLHITGLCLGNSPGTGEFPAQMASNAESVSIWWRHRVFLKCWPPKMGVTPPKGQDFHNHAASCRTLTLFTSKYMILVARNLDKVVKNSLLFNEGIKIQDGGQSHPIFSATELFVWYHQVFKLVVQWYRYILL